MSIGDYRLVFKNFRSVKDAWKKMETPDMSPFLLYDYMRYVKSAVTWSKPFFTRIACILPEGSDDILMICPLKLRIDFKYYTMLGDMQGCDIADVLWRPELPDEERVAIIHFFYDSIKKKMYLNRIPAHSLLAQCVPIRRVSFSREMPYIAIDISGDYDSFFHTLSSSVRQNIRTAYNRLHRDSVHIQFQCFSGENQVPVTLWRQIQSVYIERLITQYSKHSHFFQALKTRVAVDLKHDSKALSKAGNAFVSVLKNKDKVMAFMAGFKTLTGDRIVVPRLAIDAAYRFYSPGYVLMNETIRYLQQEGVVKVLDMSRGDEQYKKDFGGKSYFIKDFVIEKV